MAFNIIGNEADVEIFPNCKVIAGKYSLKEELDIMANLDLMISMDSANMHLATLVGIKVISIWGPTHHFLGFGPLMNEALIVESLSPKKLFQRFVSIGLEMRRIAPDNPIKNGKAVPRFYKSRGSNANRGKNSDAYKWLDHADQALYLAKEEGRNRVNTWLNTEV